MTNHFEGAARGTIQGLAVRKAERFDPFPKGRGSDEMAGAR